MSARHGLPGRVLVFARAPVAGATKTRLIPVLGAGPAAELSAQLLHRTLEAAGDYPLELWCTPTPEHEVFVRCRQRYGVTLHVQRGADLGARMGTALEEALGRAAWAILIGTDCPELSSGDLHRAAGALQDGADAVLGPALDGGYYLIGLRRPLPALFRDMPWGTAGVLDETRRRLAQSGCRWEQIAVRRDLDRPEDLEHFPWLRPRAGVTEC